MSSSNPFDIGQPLALTHDWLSSLVNSPQKKDVLQAAFGDSFDTNAAIAWLDLETQNFSNFPSIQIVSSQEINYARGAYSADTDTIYLSTEFVTENARDNDAIARVIIEEYGHFLDNRFNSIDAPGDEGYLFAGLARQKSFTPAEIAIIKAESDISTAFIDDQTIQIEANYGVNPAFDLIGLTQLRNDPQFAGIDGTGFGVVVIDTGIDTDHPLLAPNYVGGYDFIDDDGDPEDSDGHGTHIAGTIGAVDENIGVAPGVDLIGLRILDDNGSSLTQVEDALEWVIENRELYNITAINLSSGVGFYNSETAITGNILSDDIQRLEEAGVTVVAAAGNNYFSTASESNRQNLAFPAISSTVAVGAVWQDDIKSNISWESGSIDYTTGTDRIASFSQRLNTPKMVFAPGASITSTIPGGNIGVLGGTSQASPHVSGAIALIQQASLQFNERLLSTEEIREILFTTGDPIVDGDDEDDNVANTNNSYIRINVYNAIAEVKTRSDNTLPDNNLSEDLNETLSISSNNDAIEGSTVYRFFRPDLGVHFYTASDVEKDSIIASLPNYTYEGASYIAASDADPLTGAKPVYRFLNTDTGAHLYTISEAERDSVTDNSSYAYEGVAYYGYESDRPGTIPLYRFYNPEIDAHFYTPSAIEKEEILNDLPNYQLESNGGVAFYVEPLDDI